MKLLFILILSVLIELKFVPRFHYLRESSVLVFYFFARKNIRKRIIFKI